MNQSVGQLIKKYRLRAELSQLQLEAEIGAGFGSLSKIEVGAVNPSKETLFKIATVLQLSTHEAALLYSLDLDEYRSLISSINEIHKQKTIATTLQAATNGLLKNMHILGAVIFHVEGDELVHRVLSNGWYVSKVIETLGIHPDKIKFPLNADYENTILTCAHSRKFIVEERLANTIHPVIGRRVSDTLQRILRIKAIGMVPIVTEANVLLGVLSFGVTGVDIIREKLPVILGYAEAVAIALEKFSA